MPTRRSPEIPASAETRAPGVQPMGTRAVRTKPAQRAPVSPEERRSMIAEAAYLRAERRGFGPGHETEDWLAAEKEVEALLKLGARGPAQ